MSLKRCWWILSMAMSAEATIQEIKVVKSLPLLRKSGWCLLGVKNSRIASVCVPRMCRLISLMLNSILMRLTMDFDDILSYFRMQSWKVFKSNELDFWALCIWRSSARYLQSRDPVDFVSPSKRNLLIILSSGKSLMRRKLRNRLLRRVNLMDWWPEIRRSASDCVSHGCLKIFRRAFRRTLSRVSSSNAFRLIISCP